MANPTINLSSTPPYNPESITGILKYDNTVASFPYPDQMVKIEIYKAGIPISENSLNIINDKISRVSKLLYTIGLPIYYIYLSATAKFNDIIERLLLNKEYKNKNIDFTISRSYPTDKNNYEIEDQIFTIYDIKKKTLNRDEIGQYGYLIIGMHPILKKLIETSPNIKNEPKENLAFSDILKFLLNYPIQFYTDSQTKFYNITIPNNYNYLQYLQLFFNYFSDYIFFYDEISKTFVLDNKTFNEKNYKSYGKIFKDRANPDYLIDGTSLNTHIQIVKTNLFLIPHVYYPLVVNDNYSINLISFISPHSFYIGELLLEAQNAIIESNVHLTVVTLTNYTQLLNPDTSQLSPIKYTSIITINK